MKKRSELADIKQSLLITSAPGDAGSTGLKMPVENPLAMTNQVARCFTFAFTFRLSVVGVISIVTPVDADVRRFDGRDVSLDFAVISGSGDQYCRKSDLMNPRELSLLLHFLHRGQT